MTEKRVEGIRQKSAQRTLSRQKTTQQGFGLFGVFLSLTMMAACFNVTSGESVPDAPFTVTPELTPVAFLPTVTRQVNTGAANWWQPSPGASWQWQLSGTLDTSIDVQMYDIDLVETPAATITELKNAGRTVICYFSAGSWEAFRDDADLFPESVLGAIMDGWPDERWLDIRQIDLLAPVMSARLDLAVSKGCDGVEPDNVDGYANDSGFPLTGADQLAYNRWLAKSAHDRGLSIGLKNDLDQIPELVAEFDWALNEQCAEFEECDLLSPFVEAGKAVFGVEYQGEAATFCPVVNALNFDWLHKRLALDAWRVPCR